MIQSSLRLDFVDNGMGQSIPLNTTQISFLYVET